MIPPTSIDGTDITGATIDGTDVQEITVDGQTVFTAGPDFPLIVDDFESGNLNAYTNTSDVFISSNNVAQGNFCLEAPNISTKPYSEPGDGLANYPEKGQKFSILLNDVNTNNCIPKFYWGYDVNSGDGHSIYHFPRDNEVGYFDGTSRNFTASLNFNEYYEYQVQWHDGSGSKADNTIEIDVFEIDNNLNRTNTLLSVDFTGTSQYSNNKAIAYGDASGSGGVGLFDNYIILGNVD